MFGLYTKKDVKRLVQRLKEEYEEILARQKEAAEELCSQNRALRARVLELEGERESVSSALIAASKEGERIRRDGELAAANERLELLLLAEKSRLMLDRMLKKYPDEEDTAEYAAFLSELNARLGSAEEETGEFNMDDVIAPKEPLDLEKLCRELGLMEDGE